MACRPASGQWAHQLSTWRVGVGWAITHDVYFNPYVNFYAEAPAFNTANTTEANPAARPWLSPLVMM